MDNIKKYALEESLGQEVLNTLCPRFEWRSTWDNSTRPKTDLVELMHWAKNSYGYSCLDVDIKNKKLECFIQNKIVIDGAFLQFCKLHYISVECIIRDSISSWKNEQETESFMSQGIFLIKTQEFSFIHCALFHKGNQNEDEVSFFIIMQDKHYDKYIEFRNRYELWQQERDRLNLEVHVVGGESFSYSKELKWDDIFLQDDIKNEIKLTVEGFLKCKDIYHKSKVPWKRGILLFGERGCGKTSLIKTMMANYDFKPVTIQAGHNTNDDALREAFSYAEMQGPSLLFLEDMDDLLQSTSLRNFLNLLDGVNAREGLFIVGTANDLSGLKTNVTDRPSRFDRKWEIPLPDKEMTIKYMNKWFSNLIKPQDITKAAETTVAKGFSYAHLQDLYISSVYIAISNNRDTLQLSDFNEALAQLIADKKAVKDGFKPKSKKNLDLGGYSTSKG